MAQEARIVSSLYIRKAAGNITYQSQPTSFVADVDGSKGPTPGALTVPTGGKIILFNELTTPGLCRLINYDQTNYVTYGIYDPDYDRFYPLGELLPGESYVLRLSRIFRQEYDGTGTGTSPPSCYFFMKANTAQCNVSVEAFEK